MDVVLEALNALSAVAALARPARMRIERTPEAPVAEERLRPGKPTGPIAQRVAIPVRYSRLLAHLDAERFYA